jgi:hypothetical protein
MDYEQELTAESLGADGIFLRAADRKRFEYVMRAVCNDGQCLAISSSNESVLDHYGRLVINKLRQTPDLQIEVFLPTSTDALLDRFNQILAGLSLTDARDAISSPAPRRVLVAHDAKSIDARDIGLMARLIADFPGANTSLVLFLDQSRERQHDRLLESFGQRLLRWPVEAPTRAEGDALLKVSRALGYEVEVKKLLAATGYAASAAALPTALAEETAPAGSAKQVFAKQLAAARKKGRTEPVLDENFSAHSPAPAPAFTPPPRRMGKFKTMLRWILAIVLLLVVSAAVIAVLFPQRIMPLLATSPVVRSNSPPWLLKLAGAPATAPSSVPATVPAPAAALAALPPAPPVATPEPVQATVMAATSDSSNNSANLAKPAPASIPAGAAVDKAVNKVDVVAKVEPVAPLAAVSKLEIRADAKGDIKTTVKSDDAKPANSPAADAFTPRSERGVEELVSKAAGGSYFVQHVSLTSMAEAQEWRAQYAALKKSRIAAVKTQDQGVKFAVLSGPFANRKEAEVFAARQGVPADPWLRPLASLQKALLAPTR